MFNWLFSKREKEVFAKVKLKNKEPLLVWNITNLGFPLFTLIISVIVLSYTDKGNEIKSYYGAILNGTLPLVAINIIVAASFFLIKFNAQKEKNYGLDTNNTRLKLILFSFISYLLSSALFVIQTIYNPFDSSLARYSQVLYSLIALIFALVLSNKLFLLQEEMIEKSYEESITEGVSRLKSAIK